MGRIRDDAGETLILMQQSLLAEVRALLQNSNQSLAALVALYHVDASTANYVKFISGISLTNDGGASGEIFAF